VAKSCGCTEVGLAAEVIPTPCCTNPLRPYNYSSTAPSCKACLVGAQLVYFACCCESQVTGFLTSSCFTILTDFHFSAVPSIQITECAASYCNTTNIHLKINRHMTFLLKITHQIPFGDVVIASDCTVSNGKMTDDSLIEKYLEGRDRGIFGVLIRHSLGGIEENQK